MTSFQPQLWIEHADAAVSFYEQAFAAKVLHRVGDGDDVVVQLAIGDAAFWVSRADPTMKRFSPDALGGATGRTLLIVDTPVRTIPSRSDLRARLRVGCARSHSNFARAC